jgi:hypothetical protein
VSLGIELERIDPGKPAQNGGHERMHRDLKAEIQNQVIGSGPEIQKSLDLWRDEFSRIRPHERLGMKSPADVYRRSDRLYTGGVPEIDYPLYYRTRKVNKHGYLKLEPRTDLRQ